MFQARLMVLICLAFGSAHAPAQGIFLLDDHAAPGDTVVEQDARTPSRDEPRRFRAILGGGFAMAPSFPGSDRYRAHLLPLGYVAYGPFFAGIGGLGVNLYRDSRWRFGANLSASRGRKESDDPRLEGLGDIDRTVRAGLFASYASGALVTRASVATDIGGEKQGTLVRLDLFARFRPAARLAVFAGPGLTWGSGQYTQRFFGVTAEQSARSGFREFEAKGGVDSLRLSAGMIYGIDRRWLMAANFSHARLQGDAADSPIIETRVQNVFSVLAAYRF
jgi:outer membrane protein